VSAFELNNKMAMVVAAFISGLMAELFANRNGFAMMAAPKTLSWLLLLLLRSQLDLLPLMPLLTRNPTTVLELENTGNNTYIKQSIWFLFCILYCIVYCCFGVINDDDSK